MSAIREARRSEAGLLADIISRANQDVAQRLGLTPENCPKHPSNCRVDWVEEALDKGATYFIMESGGEPAGCAALERASDQVCYLERLAVLPEFRRQGLGVALVEHALALAAAWGAGRVEIGIIAEQKDLAAWYEKLGFIPTGTKKFDHLPFTVGFMYYNLGRPQ